MSHPFGSPQPVSKRTAMKTKARTKGLTPSTKNCLLCWCRLKIYRSPTWKCWLFSYVEHLTKAIYALFSLPKTIRNLNPSPNLDPFSACSTASWRTPGPLTIGSWCSGLETTELLRGLHWSLFIVDPSPPPFHSLQRQGATCQQKAQDWGSVGTWNLKSYSESQDVLF